MNRIFSLDTMRNLSIDEITRLYQLGYRIDEYTSIQQNYIDPTVDPTINFGKVVVSTGYGSSDTSIVVSSLTSGAGSTLPDPAIVGAYNLVWWDYSDYPDPSDDPNTEIVRCTAINSSTKTLTVTRGQEGTAASTKNTAGKTYKMVLSFTAKMIPDLQTDAQNKVNAHGVLTTGTHGVGTDYIAIASGSQYTAVNKAGDTMTGTLNLPSNGLVVGTNQLIVSGGNVGIGTASPSTALEIVSSSGLESRTRNTSTTGSAAVSAQNNLNNAIQLGIYGSTQASYNGINAGEMFLQSNVGNLIVQTLGTNHIRFQINASEKMRIDSTGNVGIGTTSPSGKLNVAGIVDANGSYGNSQRGIAIQGTNAVNPVELDIFIDDTNTLVAMRAAQQGIGPKSLVFQPTGGNVGIGTTAPTALLDISGSASSGSTGFRSTTTGTTGYGSFLTLNSVSISGHAYQITSTGGSDTEGLGKLSIRDNSVAGTPTRMVIDSSGNVGIGISTISTKLDVRSDTIGSIGWGSTSTLKGELTWGTVPDRVIIRAKASHDLSLGANDQFDQLYIKSGGNVGIGTTSPYGKISNSSVNITDAAGNGGDPNNSILWTMGTQGYTSIFQNTQSTAGHRSGILVRTAATDTGSWIAKFESGSSNKVTIRSDGFVGIGTTSPQGKINIQTPSYRGNNLDSIQTVISKQLANNTNWQTILTIPIGDYGGAIVDAFIRTSGNQGEYQYATYYVKYSIKKIFNGALIITQVSSVATSDGSPTTSIQYTTSGSGSSSSFVIQVKQSLAGDTSFSTDSVFRIDGTQLGIITY